MYPIMGCIQYHGVVSLYTPIPYVVGTMMGTMTYAWCYYYYLGDPIMTL